MNNWWEWMGKDKRWRNNILWKYNNMWKY